MSERTNQRVETALQYFIGALEGPRQWPEVLPRMSAALNNSSSYPTAKAPNELSFVFRTREALDLLRLNDPYPREGDADGATATAHPADIDTDNTLPAIEHDTDPLPLAPSDCRPARIDAQDAIALAAIKMKERYDGLHKVISFKVGDYVRLRLHRGYRVPGLVSKKLGPQFVGPFKITERIGSLAYKVQLPSNMKIHNVISIAQLEPAAQHPERDPDPYHRVSTPPPAVAVDDEEEWEIEQVLQKRRSRRGRGWCTQYLVKCLGYSPEHDSWLHERELAHASELVEEYEHLHGPAAGLVRED